MSDKSQKNFDATPARKQKAERDGNVARSSEISAVAAFAGATLTTFAVVPFLGPLAARAIAAISVRPDPFHPPAAALEVVAAGLVPMCGAAAGATVASIVQARGLRASAPKWQLARLNPFAGLKRMFGGEAVVGAARAIVAFAVATAVVWPLCSSIFARATTVIDPGAIGDLAVEGAQRACWAALAVGAVFAGADFALARRRWLRDLKMTFEEMRRDIKENDGDPSARARRKALHRTLVRGSVTRTKDASFVVVNPTHIAIAIRYAPPAVAVPEVLVRAADDAAAHVKAIARRHGVPIIENVVLARALYAAGEAGRPIPSATFVAVARIIAELVRSGVLE